MSVSASLLPPWPALERLEPRLLLSAGGGSGTTAVSPRSSMSSPGGNGGGSQPQQVQVKRNVPKVGRNDPCPCGSGKKYKYCHGQ